MSEATKACETCDGTGATSQWDPKTCRWPRADCVDCSGTGRVPDVEATLRAEVARLTNERDAWRGSSARWAEDCTRLTAEVERFRASFELQGKEVSRLTVALDEMVDESRSVARDHNHLTAEVGRLTNQNGALMAQAQEDIRVLGYAVDKNLALSIENERLTAEVERLKGRNDANRPLAIGDVITLDGEVGMVAWVGSERCRVVWSTEAATSEPKDTAIAARSAWLAGCKS